MATCSTGCGTPTKYSKKRYIGYGIITAFSLIMPFLNINGQHFFLLSFDKKQVHLLFTAFDMQELYLLPFLLILLFLTIFFMTTLGGRVWCGWSCPQTIFRVVYRDLIETKLLKMRKTTKNKQTPTKEGGKKVIALLLWTVLALLAASNFSWYFVPPEDFFQYMQDPLEHKVLLGFILVIAGFLVYDITMLKENFCIYVCPYARIQSVMFDDDTIQTMYDEKRGGKIYTEHGELISTKPTGVDDECTGCEACVRICPTHIDIRKGMQLECIDCLECADACTTVMGRLGKESLIRWTSPNAVASGGKTKFLRFRTIAYGIALTIALVGLLLMGQTKEHMLLNINKTTQLYTLASDNKTVENAYIFLFQNTDSKDHTYYFETNNKDLVIQSPNKPFMLQAGKKLKKIVILAAPKSLSQDEQEDTILQIGIKAYAQEDKENIFALRNTTFIYPSAASVKKLQSK